MARPVALVVVLLVVIGCGNSPGSPSPSPLGSPSGAPSGSGPTSPEPSPVASDSSSPTSSATADDALVVVSTRGGECPAGMCESSTVIDRSGRVHTLAPEVAELGTARPDILVALEAAIDSADFDAIRSVPFTGECPVNFDGQEQVFEFSTDAGVERIASCETDVDPEHPLFATVEALLANLPGG